IELQQITYERDTAMAALSEPAPPTEPMLTLPPSTPSPSDTLPAESPATVVVRSKSSPFEIGALKLRKPVLPHKPPSSARPLIAYSATGDEIAEERLEGARLSPDSKKKWRAARDWGPRRASMWERFRVLWSWTLVTAARRV